MADILHDAAARLTAASIDDARLEADLLLAHALGIDRAHLLARLGDLLSTETVAPFASLLTRRLSHEPLAYIVGRREFYGIDVACGPGALIPRPETEMLVDLVLEEVHGRSSAIRIADVGTGSGAIGIAIAINAPAVTVMAIDASEAALALAHRNAATAGVADRVTLRRGDLLEGKGTFDVVVANLPYVSEDEWSDLPPEIHDHEPREALVGGAAGTEIITRLLRSAGASMAAGGVIAMEIGATQGAALLREAGACFPDADSCVIKDLAGLDRVLVVRTRGG